MTGVLFLLLIVATYFTGFFAMPRYQLATYRSAPEDTLCPSPQGLFPHPHNCNQFLHCDHGNPHLGTCEDGLLFDRKLFVCNFENNVDCDVKEIKPEPEDKETDVKDKNEENTVLKAKCLRARGQFPHPTDCEKFYNCWDDVVLEQRCPGELMFDQNDWICKEPKKVDCGERKRPIISKPEQQDHDEENQKTKEKSKTRENMILKDKCPQARGQFSHPTDCEKFYDCWDDVVLKRCCPGGLLFDQSDRICKEPEKVDCGERKRPIINKVEQQDHANKTKELEVKDKTVEKKVKCPQLRGQFPHSTACEKFYDCWDEVVLERDCPLGLLFDQDNRICNEPEKVDCGNRTEPKIDYEGSGKCPKPYGLFPTIDCSGFYYCINGEPFVHNCPDDLLFDDQRKRCEFPKSVVCSGKYTEVIPVDKTREQEDNIIESDKQVISENNTKRDENDNDNQIISEDGIKPENDILCDTKDEQRKKNKDKGDKREPIRLKDYVCPGHRGQFAHETDCEKFYNCWDEVVFLEQCPLGLLFDAKRMICNDADRVSCGSRVKPITDYKPTKECPEPVGLFPKDDDCFSFYHCVGGIAFPNRCPSGLKFDFASGSCGHPNDVVCVSGIGDKTKETEKDEEVHNED
ncbi:uncharacterized protein LOC106462710 isoform X2 [Limulus polyphemus]|uniref:Uncharacterized protein LOC106462710 isoform X2 n=1 Tax=Limulus polyphemus TaxID=6850 RepID=A0ABM1SQ39_LIMPO|nr:uncharacterized protein LOC106462710 isoform X2 [Limulus polyphemus]